MRVSFEDYEISASIKAIKFKARIQLRANKKRPREEDPGKEIPLRNNKGEIVGHTLVSTCDYEHLSQFKFHNHVGYATCGKIGRLHRYVISKLMGVKIVERMVVDHINRNPLDNRRENLRIASRSQNTQNRPVKKKDYTIYRNITFKKETNRWLAKLNHMGTAIRLGYYDTEMEAAIAYDVYVFQNREKYGLLHPLNFPNTDYTNYVPYQRKRPVPKYYGVTIVGNFFKTQCATLIPNERIVLGIFTTAEEAARVIDAYIVKHNIPKTLNFPDEYPNYVVSHQIKTTKEDLADGISCILHSPNNNVNTSNIRILSCDYDLVKHHSVTISGGIPKITADGKFFLLHRYIMGVTDSDVYIEHYPDPTKTNCGRDNLRIGNAQSNAQYKQPRAGQRFAGVRPHHRTHHRASVRINGQNIYDRSFSSDVYAARARDLFLLSHTDLHYWMNFKDWEQVGVKETWTRKIAAYTHKIIIDPEDM